MSDSSLCKATLRYCGASLKWPEFFYCFHFLFPILLNTAVDICASGLCLTCATAKITHCHNHNVFQSHLSTIIWKYCDVFLSHDESWLFTSIVAGTFRSHGLCLHVIPQRVQLQVSRLRVTGRNKINVWSALQRFHNKTAFKLIFCFSLLRCTAKEVTPIT